MSRTCIFLRFWTCILLRFWELAYSCDFEAAFLCDFIDIQTQQRVLETKLEYLRSLGEVKSEPNITFPHQVWEESLRNHPNEQFYHYIMDGNRNGYDIGIDRSVALDQNSRNLKTNIIEKIAITDWIRKGVEDKGNIYGTFADQEDVTKH